MAVTASSVYSKPQLIGTGSPWADDSLPPTELMTSVMSYHYPPLPPLSGELDMSHPAYAPTYHTPPPHPPHLAPFSAPNTDTASSNLETQPNVLPDKKRNKLGYHRTTIACGHCRKRKIRCVPAQADLQGRCVNCIRLKKECEFYPVDQPPPSEGRPTQLSKIPPATTGPPHPFPQATSSGNQIEMPVPHPFSPSAHQMPSTTAPTIKSESAEIFPVDTKAPLPPSTDGPFDFGGQPVTSWISADASQSPSSKPADLNPTWRGYAPGSPASAQFSPFGPTPPSAPWTPGSSDTGSREDMPWTNYPPPVRSMSYGGEPLVGHQSQFSLGHQGRQFDRRSSALSDVYTPPMGVSIRGMEASVTSGMESAGALSTGTAPQPPYGGWSEPQHAPGAPVYTYPTWGHGENGMGQPGYPEPGQITDNESPQSAYFSTR